MEKRRDAIRDGNSSAERLPAASPQETAAYIARLLANLRDMAEAGGHVLLAHLITLAQLEASWRAKL